MKDREVLVPWVEKVVMGVTAEDHINPDSDGDYPIRLENTVAYVHVDTDPAKNVRVQVFAMILRDVPPSPELFEKLNQLSFALSYFRFRWHEGVVEAITEMVGEAFRPEGLRVTLEALDAYAEQMPSLLGVPNATTWKSFMAAGGEDAGADDAEEQGDVEGEEDAALPPVAEAEVIPMQPAKARRGAAKAKAGPRPNEGGAEGSSEDARPRSEQKPPPGYL